MSDDPVNGTPLDVRPVLPVEVEALRWAIATLLPDVAILAELLARTPRSGWSAVCAAAREAKK